MSTLSATDLTFVKDDGTQFTIKFDSKSVDTTKSVLKRDQLEFLNLSTGDAVTFGFG